MEDLINIACEQALKKLTGKPDTNKFSFSPESSGVRVEKATSSLLHNKISCVDPTDNIINQVAEIEEEEDLEDMPEIDPKLLLCPKVCTIKLDDMGLFNHNSFHSVGGKEIIDRIYVKSNPVRKNVITSEKVDSVIIESSDDDNEDNEINYGKCDDDDDEVELIGNNTIEADTVVFTTNTCKQLQLLTNLDFGKSFNQLNIDVNTLVNDGIKLNDGETGVQRNLNKNDPKTESYTSKVSSDKSISKTDDNATLQKKITITSGDICPKLNETTGNPERNRAVNLPNISEVRRINQQLRTAEVPPVQTQSNTIIIPCIGQPASINYRRIAPKTKTSPHLITHKQLNVRKPPSNAPSNVVAVNNNLVAPEAIESKQAKVIECTCTKQLTRTANGNIIVKATKCSQHGNNKTKEKNDNRTLIISKADERNRKLLTTETNIIVTSEPRPQSSIATSTNLIVPSEVPLLMLLPNGELVCAPPSVNAGLKLSGNVDTRLMPPNVTALVPNVQNSFIFSVEGNSNQLNSVQGLYNGVNNTLVTTPLKHSPKKFVINEKRLCVSLVDTKSSQLEPDNPVLDSSHELQRILTQTNPTVGYSVPVGTKTNSSIKPVPSLDKSPSTNKKKRITHRLNLLTGELVPNYTDEFNLKAHTTPEPGTIDLTDGDGIPTVNLGPIFIQNSLQKKMDKETTKAPTKTKKLIIGNQNKTTDILMSTFSKNTAKQNKNVGTVFAKPLSQLLLDQSTSQGQQSSSNDAVNAIKITNVVGSTCIRIPSLSQIKSRKRNAVSAKLTNAQPLPKKSLLKPLVLKTCKVVKQRSDSIILKSIEDELKTVTGYESTSRYEGEFNNSVTTSSWVIEGI